MNMKCFKSISLLLILFVVVSCGTTSTIKNKKLSKAEDSYITLVKELASDPSRPELTADVKVKLGSISLDATLKMRWNKSIRISITPLGIMEIMRMEFLPDMVVLVDRTSQQYALEHYADLPYRNFTGLDFYSLQSLLWNKIFVPGYVDAESMVQRIKLSESSESGIKLNSTEYDYNFNIDISKRLVRTSKEGLGYGIAINYLDFKPVAEGVLFPHNMEVEFRLTGNSNKINILLDDISVENSDWPDRLPVSSRFKRSSIKEIIDNFSL